MGTCARKGTKPVNVVGEGYCLGYWDSNSWKTLKYCPAEQEERPIHSSWPDPHRFKSLQGLCCSLPLPNPSVCRALAERPLWKAKKQESVGFLGRNLQGKFREGWEHKRLCYYSPYQCDLWNYPLGISCESIYSRKGKGREKGREKEKGRRRERESIQIIF